MQETANIAALGGKPAFERPLHVAQVNLPEWSKVETVFRGIFERHYFANHGPLVRKLDEAFARHLGVRHAVCVTNGTVALMVLAKALQLEGEVIVPSFTFPATAQALLWAGLEPVFCDVELDTHMISAEKAEPLITTRTQGILGTHLWGRACDPEALARLCERYGLTLFYDACHSIGCSHRRTSLGGLGRGSAYSFHATKVLNGAEGGCVVTNDDDLAERLKTIRSFHDTETWASVPQRFNAKMSEAQAALALVSLEDLPVNIAANRERYEAYKQELGTIPGLSVIAYDPEEENNYQYVVVEVDENQLGLSRDLLASALEAENILCRKYFSSGAHSFHAFRAREWQLPNTDILCGKLLQLPNGQKLSLDDVQRVCTAIRDIHAEREALVAQVETAGS